jgi:hypothetical protein
VGAQAGVERPARTLSPPKSGGCSDGRRCHVRTAIATFRVPVMMIVATMNTKTGSHLCLMPPPPVKRGARLRSLGGGVGVPLAINPLRNRTLTSTGCSFRLAMQG